MKYSAEYIWLGGNNEFRSKTRTMTFDGIESQYKGVLDITLYDCWDYDGSSTNQASGNDSEVMLKPVAVFIDPFRKSPNVLVLCETYRPDGQPLANNHRKKAVDIFNKSKEQEPWFGLEQEFYIMWNNGIRTESLGFDKAINQGQYYCSVGAENAFGRQIVQDAYQACLDAGLIVSGMNAEVGPGQWEIQVGPCVGIEAGDNLMILRYILHRVGEQHGVQINFDPKPLKGDWNGSGCHTNYSTKEMREGSGITPDEEAIATRKGESKISKTGLDYIDGAIKKLATKHLEHMNIYGDGNDERMTGLHETASYNTFSSGVADRGASIRIPRITAKNKKGYLEDRRPGSNVDPYLVTSKLFETTVL